MRARMRDLDWQSNPLGHPSGWPLILRSHVGLMLDAQQAMFIAWGPELTFLYNDGYAPIFGAKHPEALGRPFAEIWSDIWEQISPLVRSTLAGEASWHEDLLIPMQRHGYQEDAWFSFSYTPIREEDGAVAGMYCAAMETTSKVLAERRSMSERERLRQMFEQAPGFMAMLREPDHIFELANPAYLDLIGHREVLGRPAREVLPEVEGQGYFELLDKVFTTGEPFKAQGMKLSVQSTPNSPPEDRYLDFVYQPIKGPDGKSVGIFVEGYDVTETKLAQDALKRNQETLRIALAAARLGTWERDLLTGEITASETCRANFGIPADAPFTFETLVAAIHPLDQKRVVQALQTAINDYEEYDVEYRCIWLDGSLHWVLSRGHAVYNEKGEAVRMVGVTLDLTERQENEEALRHETRALEILNRTAANVAAELTLENLVQTVVDAGVELTGAQFGAFFYTVADEKGEAFTLYALSGAPREAFSGYPHPRATEVFAPTFKGEGIVRSADITQDPRYGHNVPNKGMPEGHLPVRSYLAVPVKSRSGSVIGGLFFGHEEVGVFDERAERVMEGLAAQAAIGVDNSTLFRSLQHLNSTLELQVAERTADRDRMWRITTDIMLVARFDGTITAINPAWTKMLGWGEDDLIGRRFIDFVHPDDVERTLEEADRNAKGVVTQRFENRYRTRDGAYRWVSWITVPEDGLLHAVGRDITVEKEATEALWQAEEALRQSQKMEAVGQLTGGIAHDFNNLLQGIVGSLDIAQRRISQGRASEVDRFLTAATTTANRAAALTHRLLAFSRRQPLDPKPVKINQLVSQMEDLLRRSIGENTDLEIVLAGGLWTTKCDPHQLESAILNLAINARDAMPDGGRLTIETSNAHLDSVYAAREREVKPGQYVCVSVTDTGTGMSADTIAKAFEPFFTTKPIGQGTGLGLSMIYGFARQSDGYAKIYSEVGHGTTVKLYLPRHYGEGEEAEELPQLTEEHLTQAGEIVLVVEDEAVVRELVVEVLSELGYRAIEAHDGPSGLAVLQSKQRVDLLVTDIGLPGLNGRQVADAGRQLRPGLKVLFMTGYAENATLASGFLEPGMQMITKPFPMERLASRIKEIIDE